MHKVEYPHLWLYCKNHYKKTDELEDLRKIVAHFSGTELKFIKPSDVLLLLRHAAEDAVKYCYDNDPRIIFHELMEVQKWQVCYRMWPNMVEKDSTTGTELLLRTYRNLIMMAQVKNIELPAADPSILPLRD